MMSLSAFYLKKLRSSISSQRKRNNSVSAWNLVNGEKLTCCGDEPYNPCEKQFAENSTWLLHEAFCLESEADIFHPYEKHHSTVADASKLAEELHVKNLLLYHTEDINLLRRKELYQNEGRKYFNGIIFVPEDLETLVL